MSQSPVLKELLLNIRQHPGFEELKSVVEKPRVRPFRASEADQVEKARAQWIFDSGRLAGHDAWLRMLTGEVQEETSND